MLPQLFIAGAPKAGTTALHAALSRHPELYFPVVKEPKFFLCEGRRPAQRRGPGDAHSSREWVWDRSRYESLFATAPPGALRGECTPFYLYDRAAQRRIAALVPDARIVVMLRDPVDRAYSNWVHLRADGLEPVADLVEACRDERRRLAAGWAPFWAYRGLGLYGAQLAHLFSLFGREQVLAVRYRDLVDAPARSLAEICRFLGVAEVSLPPAPPTNGRPFVPDSAGYRALARTVRAGAGIGACAPPQVWRRVSRPLLGAMHRRGCPRPPLSAAQRREILEPMIPDILALSRLLERPFDDWLDERDRGDFATRRAVAAEEAG